MFGRVAPRYDLLNHLLSANIDRWWRRQTVRELAPALAGGARVLDLCCGSGDLLLALQRGRKQAAAGCDFAFPMLEAARRKIVSAGAPSVLFAADALELPLRAESFDVVTAAFGFRNLANYAQGLEEMLRVLRPGGTAAILEFSQPPNRVLAAAYDFYSRHVLPRVGGWISGAPDAYAYLPDSVRKFPSAEQLAEEMRRAGFRSATFRRMTGGIVALHIGLK
jgi:demethylmenaquinone methyltransferase/2-methoxy-6-polyprenyl-1,4-benzoquinol methylase